MARGNGDDDGGAFLDKGVRILFAAFERNEIRKRTRRALAEKRARGETRGSVVPYGFKLADDGRVSKKSGRPCGLTEDPEEQAVIAQARALAADGLGYGAIARALTERGVVTRTGKPFHRVQVLRILGYERRDGRKRTGS